MYERERKIEWEGVFPQITFHISGLLIKVSLGQVLIRANYHTPRVCVCVRETHDKRHDTRDTGDVGTANGWVSEF